MGCGSSSLKGDAAGTDLNDQPKPVKKVEAKKSQFNAVDYERGKDPAKASMAVDRAPHEIDHDHAPRSGSGAKDPKLEPYQTIGEEEPTGAAGGMSAGEGMPRQEAKHEVEEGQTATEGIAFKVQDEADGVIR